MKLAFIHRAGNYFFNLDHMDQTYNNFFKKALPKYAEVSVIASEDAVDVNSIDADALILWDASDWGIPRLTGIESFKGPVLLYCNDTHVYNQDNGERLDYVKQLGVTHAFAPLHEDYFYRFMPKSIEYFRNYIGIEAPYYSQRTAFGDRHPEIINAGSKAEGQWYDLRRKVSALSGVVGATKEAGFTGALFPKLLNRFRGGIAACSVFNVQKYLEVPAAGCVAFIEVTDQNQAGGLGFIDGLNAIFIDEHNYEGRIKEFTGNPGSCKWPQIAESGYEFVMEAYTNDAQAKLFVDKVASIL